MSLFDVFRQPVTVTRAGQGAWVEGVWVPGSEETLSVLASIQPVTPEDLQMLPEGRRLDARYALFSDTELNGALEGSGQDPDRVTLFGEDHEIAAVGRWRNNVINHYRYVALRSQPE